MNDDLFEGIQDKNVERMNFVSKQLRHGIVGGRPDGTMEPHGTGQPEQQKALESLLRQILNTDADLRNEISQLKDRLATEQDARAHLEKIIRQVADLIVNGSKGA